MPANKCDRVPPLCELAVAHNRLYPHMGGGVPSAPKGLKKAPLPNAEQNMWATASAASGAARKRSAGIQPLLTRLRRAQPSFGVAKAVAHSTPVRIADRALMSAARA
ncbi:MAG: hypothetical protein AMXMBFR13_16170 [Phycisphaerae bacterium]